MAVGGTPPETERRGQKEIYDAIVDAIQAKEVLRVRYLREDSVVTERDVEPFDLAPMKAPEETAFLGWCRHHDRIETRKAHRIISVRPLGETFDPAPRLETFKSPPKFDIPREW
jgi:predicted DNA-binding transcriptional regulator YafY